MKYRVPVIVEVELDLEGTDAELEAVNVVDVVMQRAWDTDQGRHHVKKWHFEIAEDALVERVPAT